jgi:predicted negative regulator of RcsB-dependent stress response
VVDDDVAAMRRQVLDELRAMWTGSGVPRFLESVGDDLAARGHFREAIAAYTEALAHHRDPATGDGG